MKKLANFALFQLGWFSCVLGAANGLPWAGPLVVLAAVAVHLALVRRPALELKLVLAAALLGLLADSLLLATGWVAYPNGEWVPGFAPYWIIAMWVLFATTLNVSMRWLRRSMPLALIAGAVGGPLSYLAGERLGAIQFVEPALSLAALAIAWAIALPVLVLLACRYDGTAAAVIPGYIHEDWRLSSHA